MLVAPAIHHFDTGPFNWYVIEDGGRLTLMDAGFPGHYRVFRDGLRSIGRDVKDVAAVVLTHAHADHMGFADRVAKEANAPVYIHKADVAASGRILQLPWYGLLSRAWRPYTASMLVRATRNGVFGLWKVHNAVGVEDGQVLDVPGRPHVIHVPGHTPGEVAFHLPDRGVLFSGDTLVTRNLYTGTLGQPQLPGRLLNADDADARRSLDRLQEIGHVTMLPGHGTPWEGTMAEAVDSARGGALKAG